jgi:outer membrane protein assembly factor BamB
VVALDMKSGSEVWRNTTREFTHATPLYIPEEDLVVIGSNDHVVRAYDAEGGALRWQFQTRGDIKSAPVYHPQKRLIAVNSMDGSCYVLHARDGTPFFAKETEFGLYSSPLIVADTLYIASLDKTITAIDITNTTVRWFYTTHGRIFSSPSFFDNSIWIGSNDGVLYELHPETGALKGRFQASERIVNAPVFDATTGRIYVATQINELYCLERDKKVVPDDYASGTRLDETTGED